MIELIQESLSFGISLLLFIFFDKLLINIKYEIIRPLIIIIVFELYL